MRQSIRALGWVVTISIILLFAFLASAVYSIFQMAIFGQGIKMGDLQAEMKDGSLKLSMPITINNTGYYEINEFKITTTLKDSYGTVIATNTTTITGIKRGDLKSEVHAVSLRFDDLLLKMKHLLFNDTEINLLISVGLKYAYALGFQISMANISMPWGAPLYGLNLKEINIRGFNGTHLFLEMSLYLENHSFLDIGGLLHLTIYNEKGEEIGEGIGFLHVPPGEIQEDPVPVIIALTHPESFTGRGYIDVSLQIPISEHPIELGGIKYG